jgi:hypothetical protein
MNVVADGKIRVLETVQGSRTFLPDCAFQTALHLAVSRSDLEFTKILLACAANPNIQGTVEVHFEHSVADIICQTAQMVQPSMQLLMLGT